MARGDEAVLRKPIELLIKFPTRNRPAQFLDVLNRYRAQLSGTRHVRFAISCDIDDLTMNNERVRSDLDALGNVDVFYGENRSKVEAINADIARYPEFEVLMIASDDMIPVVRAYDDIILRAMARYFPSSDGVLFFNDGYRGRELNTLPILGRKYYERFAYVYHPDYLSLWCDSEFTKVADLLGRQIYFDQTILRHEHPMNTGLQPDGLYAANRKPFLRDRELYHERRKNSFGAKPRVLLSVLICGDKSQRTKGDKLYEQLMKLPVRSGIAENVEIIRAFDARKSLGCLRNELLKSAAGDYVCFLDPSDEIGANYFEDFWRDLVDGVPDCIGVLGIIQSASGSPLGHFVKSAKARDGLKERGVRIDSPDHHNPVRRDIAVRYPFPNDFEEGETPGCRMVRDGVLEVERLAPQPLYKVIEPIT